MYNINKSIILKEVQTTNNVGQKEGSCRALRVCSQLSLLMNYLSKTAYSLYSFMGDMSEEQERALEQFKKYIKDNNITDHPQYDDYYLLRFLRARKFEMDKTILMFNTFMEWRKENDVDNILEVS